jgi:hypothetical protein
VSSVAVSELEALIPKLTKLTPLKKVAALYKLRSVLDEESFRHLAALLAVDLSRGENPKRWVPVDSAEEVQTERWTPVEEQFEVYDDAVQVVEDDEYVGKRVVERVWRSNIS